ncbi:MAG: DUF1810 domain-containing protein [Phenylobacterium sp.]|uniref:DUF1810 domain-containing protein n=1 Tax=Phenylobacterium sp. TaxID=1871053 RepID=UPI001A24E79E|nr:DUF1810 domain-containing protein [Phenylobacterium sp.]MBJ7412368.1 DUF1810 domain-containing protein [Phenylobacterium sp.]
MPADPYGLQRFVDAQSGTYDGALAEIRRGRKTSHWMWFVFPQLAGLGSSAMARLYAIGSLDEARAYLGHPILGPRLRDCAAAVAAWAGRPAAAIFGHPDDLKLRSSLTLFEAVAEDPAAFAAALEAVCAGERDPATLTRLTSGV